MKFLIIAQSEFSASVRTKAFIIGVALMPLMMGGAIVTQVMLERHVDRETRSFAVLDGTGLLYPALEKKASERNADVAGPAGAATGPLFLPAPVGLDGRSAEEVRNELSDRVRAKTLFAFVEIPSGIIDPEGARGQAVRYYSESPTYNDLRAWIEGALNEEIRGRRFRAASIDQALVARLDQHVWIEHLGLPTRGESGEVRAAERVDEVRTFAVPAILMFLLFIVVMTSCPQLLTSVLEEKMSRISEVLLGSVTPFELMLGKLLGSIGVSGVLSFLYFAGAFAVAARFGYSDALQLRIFLWFVLFLVLAVLLYGSMFIAIGAACTEFKDAQGMMGPAMLLIMIPLFTWSAVLKAPDSTFSVVLSLLPPATPLLMLLRLSIPPGPPAWQVLLSVVLCGGATVGCVWAAGKIFRTGLLMQGKSARLREMLRWVLAK